MQESKYSAKVIAETGLMFSITFLIVVITAYIPIISNLGMFILPIPITLLYIRHNFKISLIAVIMSMILTAVIVSPITALTAGIVYGFTGNALGYSIKNRKNSIISIIIVAIASLVGNIITFGLYALLLFNKGIISSVNIFINELKEQIDLVKEMYIGMNAPQEIIQQADQFKEFINLKNLAMLLPITLIVSSLINAYINYLITEKVLTRLKYEVKAIIPVSRIYIPNKFAALLIIIQGIGIIIYSRGLSFGNYIATVGGVAVEAMLIFSGVAYFSYLLREKAKIPKGVTAIILIVLLFMPIFLNAYVLMGLVDIVFNLRGLDPNPIRIIKSRK